MKLLYIMDPMCSWCWAFAPVLKQIRQHYPDIPVVNIMGGLAADSDEPMPESQQQMIQSIWRSIESRTGVPFNHDFWQQCQPKRSTYPACRAVLCAEQLAPGHGEKMISAIQHAYYLNAKNPSNINRLCELAVEIGLNREQFKALLESELMEQQLQQELSFVRELGVQGFPSLYLVSDNDMITLSQGYCSWEELKGRLELKIMRG
ncbi:MAG: DsbA family protein [Pontibacterium sp.]